MSAATRVAAAPVLATSARPHRTLIIGGARSGKSAEAELRLAAEPRVTYLAAGPYPPATRTVIAQRGNAPSGARDLGTDASAQADDQTWHGPDDEPDAEWAHRVTVHRSRRPPWWRTVESLDIAGLLRRETGALLIDGIGTWLAAVMDEAGMWAGSTQWPGRAPRTSSGPGSMS